MTSTARVESLNSTGQRQDIGEIMRRAQAFFSASQSARVLPGWLLLRGNRADDTETTSTED